MPARIRQPVACVLGHVDSGKTTLLDKIRGSAVALSEVGSMTQHIGASFFPLRTLKAISGKVIKHSSGKIKIPGLLVIDTPGHSIFINLRKRGGSVADIAILVLDVLRGFEPQTYESLDILKNRKIPFIVAANKIDTIPGWVYHSDVSLLESLKSQDTNVQQQLDDHIYTIIGTFSRLGFEAERFDRIRDFTKYVTIVPLSAKTGEGVPELLSILIGLTQQYMRKKLKVSKGAAKGTILEVKEEPGLGITVNVIIYDGVLHEGDKIVLGGRNKPIVTRVRALLLPKPLDEIREPREKFTPVKEVKAAAGVKIAAPGIEEAIAGAPLYAADRKNPVNILVKTVAEELEKLRIITDKVGVVLKTDTLGSLEATISELEKNGVPIRMADVGDVSRRDVIEASIVKMDAPTLGVILSFNVRILPDVEEEAGNRGIKLFKNNVIYQLIEDYIEWMHLQEEAMTKRRFESLMRPGEIKVMLGYIFRKCKPAIFGVKVIMGRVQPKYRLIKANGELMGEVLQIQGQGQPIPEATEGMQVALSMREPVIGRNLHEGDTMYVLVPEEDVKKLLEKHQNKLSLGEVEVLNKLIEVMRKHNPLWGL